MQQISYLLNILLVVIVVVCVSGCQELSGIAITKTGDNITSKKTEASKINWKGQAIKREKLSKTADISKISASEANDNFSISEIKSEVVEQTPPPIISEPALPTPPQKLDPAQFLGKTKIALSDKLGKPTIVRKEDVIEVWLYKLSACVVDFYFYPEAEAQVAKHTHMRSRFLNDVVDRASCMINLRQLSEAN